MKNSSVWFDNHDPPWRYHSLKRLLVLSLKQCVFCSPSHIVLGVVLNLRTWEIIIKLVMINFVTQRTHFNCISTLHDLLDKKNYTTRVRRCKKELDIIRKWNSTWAAGTSSALCICQQGPTVFLATFRLPAKNEIWQDVYKYIWGIAWFCWGGRNQGKLSLADLNCLKEGSQEEGWEQ